MKYYDTAKPTVILHPVSTNEIKEQKKICQKDMNQTGSILRLYPDETSEAIYWIPKELKVTLIEKINSFAKVSVNGKVGYISLLDYNKFFANRESGEN